MPPGRVTSPGPDNPKKDFFWQYGLIAAIAVFVLVQGGLAERNAMAGVGAAVTFFVVSKYAKVIVWIAILAGIVWLFFSGNKS